MIDLRDREGLRMLGGIVQTIRSCVGDADLMLIGQLHANDPERARLKLIAFGNGVHQVAMLTRKGFGKA